MTPIDSSTPGRPEFSPPELIMPNSLVNSTVPCPYVNHSDSRSLDGASKSGLHHYGPGPGLARSRFYTPSGTEGPIRDGIRAYRFPTHSDLINDAQAHPRTLPRLSFQPTPLTRLSNHQTPFWRSMYADNTGDGNTRPQYLSAVSGAHHRPDVFAHGLEYPFDNSALPARTRTDSGPPPTSGPVLNANTTFGSEGLPKRTMRISSDYVPFTAQKGQSGFSLDATKASTSSIQGTNAAVAEVEKTNSRTVTLPFSMTGRGEGTEFEVSRAIDEADCDSNSDPAAGHADFELSCQRTPDGHTHTHSHGPQNTDWKRFPSRPDLLVIGGYGGQNAAARSAARSAAKISAARASIGIQKEMDNDAGSERSSISTNQYRFYRAHSVSVETERARSVESPDIQMPDATDLSGGASVAASDTTAGAASLKDFHDESSEYGSDSEDSFDDWTFHILSEAGYDEWDEILDPDYQPRPDWDIEDLTSEVSYTSTSLGSTTEGEDNIEDEPASDNEEGSAPRLTPEEIAAIKTATVTFIPPSVFITLQPVLDILDSLFKHEIIEILSTELNLRSRQATQRSNATIVSTITFDAETSGSSNTNNNKVIPLSTYLTTKTTTRHETHTKGFDLITSLHNDNTEVLRELLKDTLALMRTEQIWRILIEPLFRVDPVPFLMKLYGAAAGRAQESSFALAEEARLSGGDIWGANSGGGGVM